MSACFAVRTFPPLASPLRAPLPCGVLQAHHLAREVFLTQLRDTNSMEAVLRCAHVLPPRDFSAGAACSALGEDVFVCEYAYDSAWQVWGWNASRACSVLTPRPLLHPCCLAPRCIEPWQRAALTHALAWQLPNPCSASAGAPSLTARARTRARSGVAAARATAGMTERWVQGMKGEGYAAATDVMLCPNAHRMALQAVLMRVGQVSPACNMCAPSPKLLVSICCTPCRSGL